MELRINRIPASLRKTNLGDLCTKYIEMEKKDQNGKPANPLNEKSATSEPANKASPVKSSVKEAKPVQTVAPPRLRGVKRKR